MAGSKNLSVFLQSQRVTSTSDPLNTLLIPDSSTSCFLASVSGTRSMVSFDGADRNRSFFSTFDEDDEIDEYLHRPEKKRRLTVEQVQFLEKSFEVENKLEHERKIQLAKDLGLQSRQVAIWFQNRRARWKSKQLEKDYDSLQASYNSLKTDYDDLLKEKDKLKQEVLQLTDKLKDKGSSELDPKAVVLVDETASEVEESKVSAVSAKSDMFDSDRDSPNNTDGVHSSILDQSNLSQDDSSNGLLHIPSYIFPKLEDEDFSDPPASSCNFGFPVDDHTFWSWAY